MFSRKRTTQWTRPTGSSSVSRSAVPSRVRSSSSGSNPAVVRSLHFPDESRGNPSSSFYNSTETGWYVCSKLKRAKLHIRICVSSSSTWQPGQHIPLSVPESPCPGYDGLQLENSSVVEVLQSLQSSIDGQFTKINSTLGEISERLNSLESKQQNIEEKIETGCVSSSITSTPQSSFSESGFQRKRRTPVSLQVCL